MTVDAVVNDSIAGQDTNKDVVIRWDGDVLVVTMNRPQASNALNPTVLEGLSAAFAEAADDRCRAVVLSGAGRNFCAGADIKAYQIDATAMQLQSAFHPPLYALAALRKPVIAALNGAVAGGGLGFALAADIRIMGQSARLHPAWVHIGLAPDLGASWMLPRLMGYGRAYEWLTMGEPMTADRALDLGLVNAVVPDDMLLDSAIERARQLATRSPLALALTKQLLLDSYERDFKAQVEEEARLQALAGAAQAEGDAAQIRIAKFAKD
jgi:2-(1,2-epoxy-1,2-dihydrophenyl)acetyl-CoA isomerase